MMLAEEERAGGVVVEADPLARGRLDGKGGECFQAGISSKGTGSLPARL